MAMGIRVLLADDHPVVRTGIKSIVAAASDMQVVGEATNGEEAREACVRLQPDVLLLDMNMPGPSAAETVGYLRERCPSIKILVLTAYDHDYYVRGVVSAGAAGYALKDEAPETLVRAIRAVTSGDTWYSQSIVKKLAQWQGAEAGARKEARLSPYDLEVLKHIARGYDNARIAKELRVAEQTVRNHVSRLYGKIGVTSRAEAIVWARERDLE
ncbi:MAG: response regulator transcription factor [Chloroflexi bacterium]|nr:response regulator transcription factor [Chloroflexota bacterium]